MVIDRSAITSSISVTAVSVVTGLVQAVPASAAVAVDPLPDTGGSRISFGQDARANRCEAGFGLHIGGPALKAAAAKALNGTDADLAADLLRPGNIHPSVRDDAVRVDVSGVSHYVGASNANETRWETANRTYALSYFGGEGAVTVNPPEFDADITTFTSARAVRSAARTRCPPDASLLISLETVGSEATGPNTAGSARNMPTSARQSPPSATASATSSRILPGSCTVRGFRQGTSAADIAASRPDLPIVSTNSTAPACETTPRPPPSTRTRG